MASALISVATWDSLNTAWRTLYKKSRPSSRNTTGVDDISINDFARDEKANLNKLSRSLRKENFSFSKLRPHLIPKTNGKERLICIPTVSDRIVQRVILEKLSTKYHSQFANRISFGFIKNRGKYALRLMPKQFERIREAFLRMTSIKELLSRKITLQTLGRAIEARKNGYLQAYVNCKNFRELENFLDDLQRKVLKKIFVAELNIDIQKLTKEARTFLNLSGRPY